MTALDFQFVQGSERLDWGVLVSIDIQRLIKDTNVDTLQRVVENIAFARLTRDEAAMFTPDHFIHLYTLCQLVIQYLVCSQECLAKINVKLNERMQESQQGVDSLKQECDRLNQENSVLRKEVKAQRRTLLAYEYNRAGRNATAGSTYICPQCGEMYGKCESLQSHIRKRHMMKPAVESPLVQVQPQQQPQTALEPPRQPEQWKTDYDLKMHQLQDKLSSIEQLLEKERDRNDRLQREGMMMMMQAALIGQKPASPVPPSAEGGKADVQAGQPISPQQQKLEQTKSEPTLPGLPTVQAAGVAALPHRNSQQSLFAVPVVPDVAALQQYNNTRQQEASNSALVKQVEELQKVVKSLKEGKQSESALPATSVSGNAAGPSASPSWLTVNEMQQGNAEKPAISALLSRAANVGSADTAKVGPDTNTSVPPLQTQPLRAVQELNPQCVAMTQQPLIQQQHPLDLQRETRTLPTATQQLPLQQPVALHPTASATIPLAPQQVPPATAQMVQQHPSDPHYQTHAFPTATQRTSLDQQQPITGLTTITAPPIESPKIQTAQQTSTHLATQQAPNPQHVPSTQQPLAPASIQQQHPLVEPNQIYAPSAVPQQLPFPGARPAVPQPLQPQPQPQLLPSAPQAATAPPVQQQQEVTKGEPQTVPAPHTSVAPPSLSQQPQPHTVTEVVHNTSHLTAGVVAPVDVMPITSAARPSKCIVSNCASSMASMGSLPQLFSTLKPPGQVQNSGKSSLLDDSLSVRPKPSTAAPGVDCQVVQHLVSSSKPSTAASSCTPEWLRNDSITDSGRNGATGRGYAPTGGTNFAIPKESNVVPTAPMESPPGLASTTGVAVSPPGTHPNAGLETSNSAIRAIPVPVQQHQPGPKVMVPPFAASLPVPVPTTSPPLSLGSGVAPMHVETGVAQERAKGEQWSCIHCGHMLQRIPPYRDPLVQLLADALIRGLEIYRKNATSDVLVEFECRLGTYSASRHNFTHPFATNTQTPAVLDTAASAAPFHFFSGVSQATFHALHEKLKKTAPAACVPSRSTATLFVHTAGTQRLEYAMNASCSEGQLLSGSEKERLFVHDVRCPAWAADFRVCVSRETRIPVKTWDLSTWQLFTPKVSRLRQRKSVRVGALLTVDLAVVRSFTDHSRIARPLGQQLQLPLISAPYLSHDVELEVNLEALHREVRRTRLVESTVWHTAQDVLKLIQFLTVK